jgi:hypothetical protein
MTICVWYDKATNETLRGNSMKTTTDMKEMSQYIFEINLDSIYYLDEAQEEVWNHGSV